MSECLCVRGGGGGGGWMSECVCIEGVGWSVRACLCVCVCVQIPGGSPTPPPTLPFSISLCVCRSRVDRRPPLSLFHCVCADPGWNVGETCRRKEPVHTVRGRVFCAGSTDTRFCTMPRGPADRCPRTSRMSAGTVGVLLLSLSVVGVSLLSLSVVGVS